jgi:hypothetical protein
MLVAIACARVVRLVVAPHVALPFAHLLCPLPRPRPLPCLPTASSVAGNSDARSCADAWLNASGVVPAGNTAPMGVRASGRGVVD